MFDVPLVIQLTGAFSCQNRPSLSNFQPKRGKFCTLDDEKFLFKSNLSVDQVRQFSRQTARDIIACGFKLEKTFIFNDFDFVG